MIEHDQQIYQDLKEKQNKTIFPDHLQSFSQKFKQAELTGIMRDF